MYRSGGGNLMWGGGEEGSSKTMLIQQGGGGSNRDSVETVVYSDSPQQQQRHLVTSGQGHPSGHGSWSHLGTLPRGHGSGGRRNLAAECALSTNSATRYLHRSSVGSSGFYPEIRLHLPSFNSVYDPAPPPERRPTPRRRCTRAAPCGTWSPRTGSCWTRSPRTTRTRRCEIVKDLIWIYR